MIAWPSYVGMLTGYFLMFLPHPAIKVREKGTKWVGKHWFLGHIIVLEKMQQSLLLAVSNAVNKFMKRIYSH